MIKKALQRISKLGRRTKTKDAAPERGASPKERPATPSKPSKPVGKAASGGAAQETNASKDAQPRRRRARGPRPPRADGKPTSRPTTQKAAPASSKRWDPASFQVPEEEGKTRFHDLDLGPELMHAISDLGFQYCTPIQAETLPAVLKGRDVAGRAQTGTGKTAAFLIRIFQHMLTTPSPEDRRAGEPRALVLAPTRELAMQIQRDAEGLERYCPFSTVALFGGEDYEKQHRLVSNNNPELIAATPGRLLDFKSRRHLHLDKVEILVIDEADRMLDMGFIPDVRKIVLSTPAKDRRQTMLFSATLTEAITRLAANWTRNPVRVEIDPEQVAVDTVNQIVYIVTTRKKFSLLYNLLGHEHLQRVLLFTNRRDTASRLAEELQRYGIDCAAISGALPQNTRTRVLKSFREGRLRVLVATDVASRGLHIDDVDHVINYNLPEDPENYVHRIGRTGRAGNKGTSVTFACEDEAMYIPDVEAFIGRPLECTQPPDEWLTLPPPPAGGQRTPRPIPTRGTRQSSDGARRGRPGGGRPRRRS